MSKADLASSAKSFVCDVWRAIESEFDTHTKAEHVQLVYTENSTQVSTTDEAKLICRDNNNFAVEYLNKFVLPGQSPLFPAGISR